MTHPTAVADGTDTRSCGCCGRAFPARRVTELGVTPGVFICAGCAFWAARRAGVLSSLRAIRLPSLWRRRAGGVLTARAVIPILPSSDLAHTAAFYAVVGFGEVDRTDDYLVLHNGGAELHFTRQDIVQPGTCFVHVLDATKLWKQLRHQGVAGVGEIADQDYGLREFVLTDPDDNRIRVGSPLP